MSDYEEYAQLVKEVDDGFRECVEQFNGFDDRMLREFGAFVRAQGEVFDAMTNELKGFEKRTAAKLVKKLLGVAIKKLALDNANARAAKAANVKPINDGHN